MAKKQKRWARRARAELIRVLGARCAACGTDEALTFDCVNPVGDAHHRLSTDQRICFYRQQARAGNVQLLCASCNSLKADQSILEWNTVLTLARCRSALRRPPHSPVQETREISRVIRSYIADVVNAAAQHAGNEPF